MKRTVPALLATTLLLVPAGAQTARDVATMDDEEFVSHLESTPFRDEDPRSQLDQRRLSKLLFSIGATFGGGKTNVRMLQGAMQLRDAQASSTREMTAARYADYDAAVERYRADVSSLLDRPESLPLVNRVLNDGHEVCYRLDAYTRLMETYGVSVQDLVSILASREACAEFRRAAFSSTVQGTIGRALQGAEEWRRQVQGLQEEITELEKLVQDLREIEGH